MKQNKQIPSVEPDTLSFHREMYERRMRKLKQRRGVSEREISEQVNNPSLFRRVPETVEAGAKREPDEQSKSIIKKAK